MEKIILRLYILNGFPKSREAEEELKLLLKDIPSELVEYEVIDLHMQPEKAEEDKILATPALVKLSPPPVKKLIGSFTDKERVLKELNIEKYTKGKYYE